MLVFHFAFFETTIAQRHAVRHANEFPIGEHGTRALATIIEQHIDTRRHEIGIELFRYSFDIGAAICTDGANDHGERRYGIWPNDAFGIVILLNGRRRQARHTNAVATHF